MYVSEGTNDAYMYMYTYVSEGTDDTYMYVSQSTDDTYMYMYNYVCQSESRVHVTWDTTEHVSNENMGANVKVQDLDATNADN